MSLARAKALHPFAFILSGIGVTSRIRSKHYNTSKNFLQYTYLAEAFYYLVLHCIILLEYVAIHADKLDTIYKPSRECSTSFRSTFQSYKI